MARTAKQPIPQDHDWYAWERRAQEAGYGLVCGIDEAGRGPLAGPVCAAAVILPLDCQIPGLNDSKKLTEKKREALFPLAFTGFALLAFSFLLASPSALFMLLTLDLLSGSLRDAGVNAFFQSSAWFAAMFLAGLLPPMLFFLGSLLPKKRLTTAKNVIK